VKNYSIKKGFIVQKLGNKTVIFDGEKSLLYTFNETASFIFAKLKKNWTVRQIIDGMVKKYQQKPEKITADVRQNIKELKAKKIITAA